MRVYNSILSNLRESASEAKIVDDLVNEINSIVGYAEEIDDPDDVFYGTEDSYANEVMEQNLFDAIAYSPLCNEDWDLASKYYDKITDIIFDGKRITRDDIINVIYEVGGGK